MIYACRFYRYACSDKCFLTLLAAAHVGQRSFPFPSPPSHWVALETSFMLPPPPLSYTLLTTLIFPMRNLAPAIMTQLLMCASQSMYVCMYVRMYRAELGASYGLSLPLFRFWFVPTQGILGAVCDQQPRQRKGVACQFKQGASQDHRSQHSLQRGRDFSWWQCHYHWYAVYRVINSCDRMSLFPSSCCPLFSSSSMNNIAWADGTIRAYYPESGKPMYTIHNAHGKVGMHFIWPTQLCYFPITY